MDLLLVLLTIIGLAVFETVSSLDNVLINSQILSTMRPESRKWFMSWGILISVFIIRGALPLLLLWIAVPSEGPIQLLTAGLAFNGTTLEAIKVSANTLLAGGGIFLIAIFLHWLLVEEDSQSTSLKISKRMGEMVLYLFLFIMIMGVAVFTWSFDTRIAIGAFAGVAVAVIIFKVREIVEKEERAIEEGRRNKDLGKIVYLEIIDASFSLDSVVGAFAFTFSVPLILLGNGLGAIIVRYVTLENVERAKRYQYLKDGAMYSIFFFGLMMAANSLGFNIPDVVAPVMTFAIVGYFFYRFR